MTSVAKFLNSLFLRRVTAISFAIVFSLSITGCGWTDSFFGGEDNSIPPTELEDISSTVNVL